MKSAARKNRKTTTYSLDWDTVSSLEARLIRDFNSTKLPEKGLHLLMISIGSRLGLRVADNLALKWGDLMHIPASEPFVVIEKKTGKERILSMGSRLREVLDLAIGILNPNPEHYIFTSQKGKGFRPMTVQNFNRILRNILTDYRIRYIGNPSSHLLRKSFVVGSIKKGFEDGDHLSLIKVSRLINHSSVSVTLKYTNFETSTALGLYELK